MQSFLDSLHAHPWIGPKIAHARRVPGRQARFADPSTPLPRALVAALAERGIERLYSHQAAALDAARAGRNVLAVTPTASGKTFVFALPVLETILEEPGARAIFLYPTKALAQDQVKGLRELAAGLGGIRPPRFEIYDGDTPDSLRRLIKADPPEVLVTNPDMLHLGILAHHHDWAQWMRDLRWIVLDELHVYRGIFGAHVSHVLARLKRLAAHYGAAPRFIAASATIGEPGEFAKTLTGEAFEVIGDSGAPSAARHVAILNPVTVSPYTAAVRIVGAAANAGLRTIAFTKARRVTELLHQWISREHPDLARRVAPYRAGYLPEERRHIEGRLARGELHAVLSTSALELGIDIGGLDVCVLVGYPGSLTSSWQRIGRVGRQDRDALVVLIALPDALDQYLVAHPDLFFDGAFERAVLDPWNPAIASAHLVCAAAEEPLREEELTEPRARDLVTALERDGRLRADAAGTTWYSHRRRPQRDVGLRSAGTPFTIVTTDGQRLLGTIDAMRVHHECHPGAIYLHAGQSFLIKTLDIDAKRVEAEPARVDYYTNVLGEKETEILERLESAVLPAAGADIPVGLGRLRVTVRIRGYQKKRFFDGEPISTHPLEAPPLIFETVGFWIELPGSLPAAFTADGLHFMGGIHAAEHAAIGLFPLLAISDRGDIGGISYPMHPQLAAPAIFVYDGVPGGAGLAERGFRELPVLLRRTLDHVASCACDEGCPACIQSPRCGNGNKPLDKAAAIRVLRIALGEDEVPAGVVPEEASVPSQRFVAYFVEPSAVLARRADDGIPGVFRGGPTPPAPSRASEIGDESLTRDTDILPDVPARAGRKHGVSRAGRYDGVDFSPDPEMAPSIPSVSSVVAPTVAGERIVVFDLETQRSAEDVGGWGNTSKMGIALAVAYDVTRGSYTTYYEADIDRLLLDLAWADRVVGFNIHRFDLTVLSGYTDRDLRRIRTIDLLDVIHRSLGFRLSLGHLSEANLGEAKAGDGLQSLRWWKEGRIDLIEQYCRKDVEVTWRLWALGRERGYLLYRDREGRALRVPVSW